MSGWKVDCNKYKRTEALFNKIWISLVIVADTDHDGKITITEWLALWESYKKELVARERETKNFFRFWFFEVMNPNIKALKEAGVQLGEMGEWDRKKEQFIPHPLGSVPDCMKDTILPSW